MELTTTTYNKAHLPPYSSGKLGDPSSGEFGFMATFAGDRYEPTRQNYAALVDERAYLIRVSTQVLEQAEARRPAALTKHEQNQDDAIHGRLAVINALLNQHEERRAAERGDGAGDGHTWEGQSWPQHRGGGMLLGDAPGIAREIGRGPAAGPKFAQMFTRGGGTAGFQSLGEFLGGLHAGMWDNRYQALVSGSDGNGTSLQIPEQFAAELFDMSLEGEIVRPRARPEPMTSDTKKIAGFKVGTGGNPFGISGGWTTEGAEIDETSPQSRAVTLGANGLKVLVQISNEAAADGSAVDAQLVEALTRGLGWLLDSAFLNGTGAGQPQGVFNAACTITVSKETGQAAASIYYENLTKMLARLHPASFNNSVWVANPTTIPQLLELTILSGTGGTVVPVLRETDGAFYLLTRPIVFTEKVPALGTKGDIGLYDFKQYAVGMRAELRIEKSGHAGFTRDTTYYRGVVRADGAPMWDAPYTPDNGDTTSPFVVLQTRS